jgi:hypothetical protein
MNTFFHKNWGLYYILFFLLVGAFIYSLLWKPIEDSQAYKDKINKLQQDLLNCNSAPIANDTVTRLIPDNTVKCDASVKSGGQGETVTQHELGNNSGTVEVFYEMQVIPDEITIYYADRLVAKSTGLVKGQGKLMFEYTYSANMPTFCTVIISAPQDNTQWEYLLNCPN